MFKSIFIKRARCLQWRRAIKNQIALPATVPSSYNNNNNSLNLFKVQLAASCARRLCFRFLHHLTCCCCCSFYFIFFSFSVVFGLQKSSGLLCSIWASVVVAVAVVVNAHCRRSLIRPVRTASAAAAAAAALNCCANARRRRVARCAYRKMQSQLSFIL